jgi:branched-chain amino acid transport system permease protein
MWLAFILSLLVSAVVGLLFALILVRANEFYFGIATLAIAGIGTIVFQNWDSFTGPSGLRYNIPAIGLDGHLANSEKQVFWVFLVLLVVALLVTSLIERSALRREAIAARDSAVVAQTLGIPVAVIQVVMFIIGSVFAGAAGSLYGHWQGFVSPTTFGLDLSIGIFLMAIMGGLGSMWGMIIGAAFYVFIPQTLSVLSQYQNIIYGGLLVVIIILLPEGIVGIVDRVRDLRRPPSAAVLDARTSQGVLARLGRLAAHAQRPRH